MRGLNLALSRKDAKCFLEARAKMRRTQRFLFWRLSGFARGIPSLSLLAGLSLTGLVAQPTVRLSGSFTAAGGSSQGGRYQLAGALAEPQAGREMLGGRYSLQFGSLFTLGSFAEPGPHARDDVLVRVPGEDWVKIFVAELLDNDSVPDGETLSLVADQVPATSANGSVLSVLPGSRWILYQPAEAAPTVSDTFSYQVQDTQGRTDTARVTLQTEIPMAQTRNRIRAVVSGNDIEVEFRGIPGRKYKVQYTTSMDEPITWIDTGETMTAGARGRLLHRDLNAAVQHGSKFFRTVVLDE